MQMVAFYVWGLDIVLWVLEIIDLGNYVHVVPLVQVCILMVDGVLNK